MRSSGNGSTAVTDMPSTKTPALTIGQQVGPYNVRALLGAGGMGEVYLARDRNLDRDVALKVLPQLFEGDGERLSRFLREAKVLAALNHPNIAAIYGREDSSSGIPALVLEFVDGPTLADRLERGPIPRLEAIGIAIQITRA